MLIFSPPATNGLTFIHIHKDYMEFIVSNDAVFAVHGDKPSQLSIVAMTRDNKTGCVDIIHYKPNKSKRFVRLYWLLSCLLSLVVLMMVMHWSTYSRMFLTKKVNSTMYTDSRSLYGLCISLSKTT